VGGAWLLWEVSTSVGVDTDARKRFRDLIALRDGQYMFRQVIEQFLGRAPRRLGAHRVGVERAE